MTTKFDIIKLKSLAAMGNVDAMYTLGGNYLYGIGVDVDLEQAHSYLEIKIGVVYKMMISDDELHYE